AQDGGATNINVLYRFGKGATRPGNGYTEREELDDQQIDTVTAVLFQRPQMSGAAASRPQATVTSWTPCFATAIRTRWPTGVLGPFANYPAGLGQQLGGATSGEKPHSALGECLGKFDNTGFVGDREKSCLDFHGR